MFSLVLVLRGVALLILLIVMVVYFNSGDILIKQFILANVLFLLSIFDAGGLKRLAIISIVLAIIVLIGTAQSYMADAAMIEVTILNVIAFVFLIIVSVRTIMRTYSNKER